MSIEISPIVWFDSETTQLTPNFNNQQGLIQLTSSSFTNQSIKER